MQVIALNQKTSSLIFLYLTWMLVGDNACFFMIWMSCLLSWSSSWLWKVPLVYSRPEFIFFHLEKARFMSPSSPISSRYMSYAFLFKYKKFMLLLVFPFSFVCCLFLSFSRFSSASRFSSPVCFGLLFVSIFISVYNQLILTDTDYRIFLPIIHCIG